MVRRVKVGQVRQGAPRRGQLSSGQVRTGKVGQVRQGSPIMQDDRPGAVICAVRSDVGLASSTRVVAASAPDPIAPIS